MQQDETYVAARIIGPLLIATGIAAIAQPERMMAGMADFIENDGLTYLAGFVTLALGLTLVTLHRRWHSITAIIISLIGWIAVVRGLLLLLAPVLIRDAAIYVINNSNLVPIAGCVFALIGVYLSYSGYIAGTLRVDTTQR